MLIEDTLFGRINKVDQAIQRLKAFEPDDGYLLAFSGGKDSVVIRHLAGMAGVQHENHYSITSVDPPELVRFIKTMPDVSRDYPGTTMWRLIEARGVPLQNRRFCCEALKEGQGKGRVTVTGVRWAESARRKANKGLVNLGNSKKANVVYNTDNDEARRAVESCYRTTKTLVNPIIDWTDEDVWEFIKVERIPYCELYDQGIKRLGCIGCPMSRHRVREFVRWPTYYDAYLRAFQRLIDRRIANGNPLRWNTGQEVMNWWLELEPRKQIEGQIGFGEIEEVKR